LFSSKFIVSFLVMRAMPPVMMPVAAVPAVAVTVIAAVVRRCWIIRHRGTRCRGHGSGSRHWNHRSKTREQHENARSHQKFCHQFHF
jgi:hypothetical protein